MTFPATTTTTTKGIPFEFDSISLSVTLFAFEFDFVFISVLVWYASEKSSVFYDLIPKHIHRDREIEKKIEITKIKWYLHDGDFW